MYFVKNILKVYLHYHRAEPYYACVIFFLEFIYNIKFSTVNTLKYL